MDFIQKLIDFVANNKLAVTNCLASRVLAGLEPNKTNELLQALAKLAIARRNSSAKRPKTFVKQQIVATTNSKAAVLDNNSSPTSGSRGASGLGVTVGSGSRQIGNGVKSKAAAPLEARQPNPTDLLNRDSAELSSNEFSRKSSLKSIQSNGDLEKSNIILNLENQVAIASESDILKGIQSVRTNLKTLKQSMDELARKETNLRELLYMLI